MPFWLEIGSTYFNERLATVDAGPGPLSRFCDVFALEQNSRSSWIDVKSFYALGNEFISTLLSAIAQAPAQTDAVSIWLAFEVINELKNSHAKQIQINSIWWAFDSTYCDELFPAFDVCPWSPLPPFCDVFALKIYIEWSWIKCIVIK